MIHSNVREKITKRSGRNPLYIYRMQQNNFSIDTILTNLRIEALNEMQQAALQTAKEHDNVVLLSATGSGKSLAFLLPILPLLDSNNKNTQALILVPSRE